MRAKAVIWSAFRQQPAAASMTFGEPPNRSDARRLPLCVDLDGTLVRTDTLLEMCALALRDPVVVLRLPFWLARGRAVFKRELARRVTLDPVALPYETRLLRYLRGEQARGRPLVLVTAADRRIADAVARHLGLFNEVMASDGTINLKGRNKADALTARFGRRGFVYAGDSRADLPVWEQAAGAIVVNAAPAVVRLARMRHAVEFEVPREKQSRRLSAWRVGS